MPSPTPKDRLVALLGRLAPSRARRVVLCVAVLLCVPALWGGLALDDHILIDQLRGRASSEGAGRGPLDLFVFADGDPERNARLMDAGAGLAWWTFEGAKGAFLRPLASLTHALDAWLWPSTPALMYAHSLLWLALVLVLATRTYVHTIGHAWVVGVATALFALDAAHAQTAGWIANRNALIAGAFGMLALLAHHRHRMGGERWAAVVSPLALLAGLLAGEIAIGAVGYLVAHALFVDRGAPRRRVLALAPHVVVVVAWRAVYSGLGYGTFGLGTYLDPSNAPMAFAAELPRRWTVLAASQLAGPPADLFALVPSGSRLPLVILAGMVVILFAWLAWPTLRARRKARFFATGAALSAVPMCATWPSTRLLLFVGFGAMGLLALVARDVLSSAAGASLAARTRVVMVCVPLGLGLVLAPIQTPVRVTLMSSVGAAVERASASLPDHVGGRTVVIAHVPSSIHASYVQVIRAVRGEPRPARVHWLAATPEDVAVERLDAHTLRLRPVGGFLPNLIERHYRDAAHPMRPGHRVRLSEMTVHVVEVTGDGRPAICDFRFERPLESSEYDLWRWQDDRLVPLELPPVGGRATLSLGAGDGEQKLGNPRREGHERRAEQTRQHKEQPVAPGRVSQPQGLVQARPEVKGQPEALHAHELEAAVVEQPAEGVGLEEDQVPRDVQVPPTGAEGAGGPPRGVGDLDGHVAARLQNPSRLLEHGTGVGLVLEVLGHGHHVHAARGEAHVLEGAPFDAHAELGPNPVDHLLLEVHPDALGAPGAVDPIEQAVDAAPHVHDGHVRGQASGDLLQIPNALQADAAGEPPEQRPKSPWNLGGQGVGEVVIGVVGPEGLGDRPRVHVQQAAAFAPHQGVFAGSAEQAIVGDERHGGASLSAGGATHLLLHLTMGEARELSDDGGHRTPFRESLPCTGGPTAVATALAGGGAC
jgi:hypothetical protein